MDKCHVSGCSQHNFFKDPQSVLHLSIFFLFPLTHFWSFVSET